MSPGTRAELGILLSFPSLRTVTSPGNMPVIDSRILEAEKSCQKLKIACNARTMRRTIAKARFDGAGGLPSGFLQCTKRWVRIK